jgi:lipopolysaccharide transport system permease protein
MLLFGRIANIPTDGIPQFPFYLIGLTLWNFFSETLNTTSKTFTDNSALFGKVYFPRLIMPLSKVASGFIKFLIQFGFFIIVWGYCVYKFPAVTPNWYILLSPILLLLIVGIALAAGILVTSLTTKYRDLVFLITFVVQLLMYATPIAYSMSDPKLQKFSTLLWLNPLTSLFEAFKYCFFGKGVFSIPWLLYSLGFTVALFIIGLITFNKVEKHFIDTV